MLPMTLRRRLARPAGWLTLGLILCIGHAAPARAGMPIADIQISRDTMVADGQDYITVSATVRDSDTGDPMPNLTIQFEADYGVVTPATLVTNSYGRAGDAQFRTIDGGTYNVYAVVSGPYYAAASITATAPGTASSVSITSCRRRQLTLRFMTATMRHRSYLPLETPRLGMKSMIMARSRLQTGTIQIVTGRQITTTILSRT